MTVPVLNDIHLTKEETELECEVVTAYYLPGEFQQNPLFPWTLKSTSLRGHHSGL